MALEIKSLFRNRFKISEERLEVCRKCEDFNHENSRCGKCGCIMDYKTLLPFAECPVGKWVSRVKELEENAGENK